jgi:hypothetical protein
MDKRRKWFAVLLDEGLRLGVLSPEDVLRHVTPGVLATDLPPDLVASILQAGLDNQSFDPALVVQTLGAENLAAHAPLPLIWACLDQAAGQIIKEQTMQKGGRTRINTPEAELVVEPGEVRPEDVPVIEVLED